MQKTLSTIASITLVLGALSAPPAFANSQAVIPIIDMYHQSCYLPRFEVTGEQDQFQGFETVQVSNCDAALEPRPDSVDDDYRAYASNTRTRPGAAGSGPQSVSFNSDDYEEVPCAVVTAEGVVYLGDEWQTSVFAVTDATRHNITCIIGEEAEEEELKALGISVK